MRTMLDARGATLSVDPEGRRAAARQALWRAGMMNILSPHPWVFWATVGGPLALTTWSSSPSAAVGMVAAFYVAIVGTKVLLAMVVARGRHLLSDRGYRRALVVAGVLLVVTAVVLAVEFWPVAFGG